MKTNEAVQITELKGALAVTNTNLANTDVKLDEFKIELIKTAGKLDLFVSRREFDDYCKRVQPVISWVSDRKAVERFLVGVVSLIGASQVATILIVISKLISA